MSGRILILSSKSTHLYILSEKLLNKLNKIHTNRSPMTERRKFEVIQKIGKVEIRKFLPCVMADVVVNSDYERAGNIGFRPLVTYISRNQIAMTAPVILEENSPKSWTVSFVMPAGKTLKDFPIPKDSQVSLREVPDQYVAALPFSGITNQRKIDEMAATLRNILNKENISIVGQLQIARFDPPWKPGFLRYNEVIYPIKLRSGD